MSRVRYQLAISIDGFIAPEDGSLDWLAPYGEFAIDFMNKFMEKIGGVIMGRETFDQHMATGGAEMFGELPTLVMTSRPVDPAPPAHLVIADGAPAPALARLKTMMRGGDIWLMGGGRTAWRFLEAGLIDTIELTTVPVLLGAGRPLFAGEFPPRTFSLYSSVHGDSGVVSTVYERA